MSVAAVAISAGIGCWYALGRAAEIRADASRVAFLHTFIESVILDTEYYKDYIRASDLPGIAHHRSKMQNEFTILGVEEPMLWGSYYEYIVKFNDGTMATVGIDAEGGLIRSANLQM